MSVQLGPWDFVHARFPDMKLQMMESSPFEVIIFPSLCFSWLGYGTRRSLSPWKKGPPCTYCSAPRPVFVEKVLKETDWNSISSSILLGISTQVALKFFFPLHELVEMSQGCLIWRDLHIKQKFFIIHIPSSSPRASTHRQPHLHSPAFISLLPICFRTVLGSYSTLLSSFQPVSLVSQIVGCVESRRKLHLFTWKVSFWTLASFSVFQILELRASRNDRRLKDSMAKP